MKKTKTQPEQQFTKQHILDRVDQYQDVYGCDRQRAFLFLRGECPDMWERLGEFFRAEARVQAKAA